jgi:hypothetical protein
VRVVFFFDGHLGLDLYVTRKKRNLEVLWFIIIYVVQVSEKPNNFFIRFFLLSNQTRIFFSSVGPSEKKTTLTPMFWNAVTKFYMASRNSLIYPTSINL